MHLQMYLHIPDKSIYRLNSSFPKDIVLWMSLFQIFSIYRSAYKASLYFLSASSQDISVLEIDDHVCTSSTKQLSIPNPKGIRDYTVREISKFIRSEICADFSVVRRLRGRQRDGQSVFLIALFGEKRAFAYRNASTIEGEPLQRQWDILKEGDAFPLVKRRVNVVSVYSNWWHNGRWKWQTLSEFNSDICTLYTV